MKDSFEPTMCSDCSYPPNFIITPVPGQNQRKFFVKCRDCGDAWEELDDSVDDE